MKASRVEEQYNNQLESIKDQIEAGLESGKYTLAEIQKAIVGKTKEAAETTDNYVHENPWTALGVAAALGVVVGFLMNRR